MVKYKISYYERKPSGIGFRLKSDFFETFDDALSFVKHMAFHYFRFDMLVPVVIEGTDVIATQDVLLYNSVSIDNDSICLWNCFKFHKGD